ncbi:MAG: bifunctional oligoribonuclease/PAP phosphatase NrnA [Flavobacteriales bacterium]|nr:bifunctional oligoribonuclease/PAP phosphatase NrnA [Flavobacteriales bacterium]
MQEIKQILSDSKSIVITTHKSPDGDAIGSSLALYHFLKKKNKDVVVIVPDAFPEFLNWMVETESIIHYDTQVEEAEKLIEKADLIFSLDYNSLNRIGDLSNPLGKSEATKVVIDHHQDPADFADHYIVDTKSCSTSQLIYEFIENLGELDKLDKAIGECIYCGIMTDTGSFRYPSTTSKTHQIIAHLIDLGVDGSKIHQEVYDTYSEHRLRLLGHALTEKMKVFPEYGAAYISLSQKELKQFSFKKGDSEGLVNYPLSIDGIKFTVLITEKEDNISFSFRSKDDFHVNKIANEHFNGGGHIYAAGGMLEVSLEEAIKKVEEVMKQYN